MSKTSHIKCSDRTCCYHVFRGAIHMVIPEGHAVLQCCKCHNIVTKHSDHFGLHIVNVLKSNELQGGWLC